MESKARTNISTASQLFPPLPAQPHQTVMVDLHGKSAERAQELVTHHVGQAHVRGWNKIRFVTGRGNHVNARGERGTLYKSFKDWLGNLQDKIVKIDQYDGYYEVDIKDGIAVRNPFSALMDECVKDMLIKDIEAIKKAAEKNEVQAMIALACCFDQGIGVKQNYQKATELYIRLAEKENLPLAHYEAGCRFYIGKGIKQNDAQAIKFLTLAANQGFVLAEFLLAEIYRKGFGAVSIDDSLATQYYLKAAQHGHAESARKLGCAYHAGLGTDKDYAKAISWWEKACQLGDCVAAFNLSAMYQDGTGVAKDAAKSVYYLKIAAELNDPDAQEILGFCYYYGDEERNVKKDKQKGLQWIKRAADNNSSQAQFFLFHHHKALNELKKAKEYLVSAALNDHIEAQFLIGSLPAALSYKKVSAQSSKASKPSSEAKTVDTDKEIYVVTEDFQKKMLERLLDHSVEEILQIKSDCLIFGIIDLLLCGDSTKKQIKKGIKILEKLAAEDNTEALGCLGGIHLSGNVKTIKKNVSNAKKAQNYWLKGAALGDSDCLCGLGYYWYEGLGGTIDHGQALMYFRQSAEKGNANANNMLGTFYSEGLPDLKKDSKKAVEYFRIAMELDNPKNRKEIRKARESFHSVQNCFKYAARNLGLLYFKGSSDFPKDEAKGIELLKQSAEDGNAESAVFLLGVFKERHQMREFSYYLHLAAKLGNKKAIHFLEIMPPKVREGMQLLLPESDEKETDKPTINKENIKSILKQLSSRLGEGLDWKIGKDDCAWSYISDSLQEKLTKNKEFSDYVKKTKDERYIIAIKDIYKYQFEYLSSFFEKAIAQEKTEPKLAALVSTQREREGLQLKEKVPEAQAVTHTSVVPI